MTLALDPETTRYLRLLNTYEPKALEQVCLASFKCLQNDSHALDALPIDEMKTLAKHTIALLLQCLKYGFTETELISQLALLECSEQFQQTLSQLYHLYRPNLSRILLTYNNNSSSRQQFLKLEWRFEVKLASRHMRQQLLPMVILRFNTVDGQNQVNCYEMQCTISDVFHMVDKLSEALRQSNSAHTNRLLRFVK